MERKTVSDGATKGRAEDSPTKGEFGKDTEITNIVRKFSQSGILPNTDPRQPEYLDVSEAKDLHYAFSLVEKAEEEFESLPSELRRMADNDPVRLSEMWESQEEREALIMAGLKPREEPPADPPVEAPVAPEDPSPDGT